MEKEIKKKPQLRKLTNKELIDSALNMIESLGFHITDRVYGNCYFLFEGDENSIAHFHIKELPRVFICILAYW